MFSYSQTTLLKIVVFTEAVLQLQAFLYQRGLSRHSESEKYWEMNRRSETGLLSGLTAYVRVSIKFRVRHKGWTTLVNL